MGSTIVYRLYTTTKNANFEGWNPPENIKNTLSWVENFAESSNEPIIVKVEGLDPNYFESDAGDVVSEIIIDGTDEASYRYTLPYTLDIKKSIPVK